MTKLSVALGLVLLSGCGHQPRTIDSGRDIKWTPASEYMVSVVDLPLSDYSKLQKFEALQHLQISGEIARVTDKHIHALAQLQFPKLRQVSLAYCPDVTDAGIQSLTNHQSIEGLHLKGTGITDYGMLILATGFQELKGINVEQCHSLTEKGFLNLTNSPSITSVAVSLDSFSQIQIEAIIMMVPNITWWTISDPRDRLDHASLRQLGESRNLTIQVNDERNSVKGITSAQPGGAANGSQPIRSETNRTSSAAGSRR